MIIIIDYGMGNLRSVQKIFHRIDVETQISSDLSLINKADKLILPGVGHFVNGMKKLVETGIREVLEQRVLGDKIPIMGICLGMQLMTKYSEEGDIEGLGWLNATTSKFQLNNVSLKIPHMGWNTVNIKKQTDMSESITNDDLFYFVHSYYIKCQQPSDILFETNYGHSFVSGFEKENIVGVQFHPEKSYKSGIHLVKNFLKKNSNV